MDILTLNQRLIEFTEPAATLDAMPAGVCRVAGMTVDKNPLRMRFSATAVTDVATNFGTMSFFVEPSADTLEKLQAMERLYLDTHRDAARMFTFKSCVVEDTLLRIKLPVSETGRRFAFECSDNFFTPRSAKGVKGLTVSITVDPKFWFMDRRSGMFLTLFRIDFE